MKKENDNRQTLPRFQPDAIRQNLRIVEVLNQFGRIRGYTPAQIALADAQGRVHRTYPRHHETGALGRESPCHGDYNHAGRDAGVGTGGIGIPRGGQPL